MNTYTIEDIKPGFIYWPKLKGLFPNDKWIAIVIKVGFRPNPDLDIFFSDSQTLIKEHRTIYDLLHDLNKDYFYSDKDSQNDK